jgi:N-hydroxyarylamine O-acetyltransferase
MKLDQYLQRIGFREPIMVTRETLFALHRAHLYAVPYENLNIHLKHPLVLDEAAIFEKMVVQKRGGWCFEMNLMFAWALRAIGFPVILLSSAVNRERLGDAAEGNHLILMVTLDQPYLVDVGFGNGLLEPIPLLPGTYTQNSLTYQLAQEGERWVFTNHRYGGPGYDFTLEPRTVDDFRQQCHWLQTDPQSGFVRTIVCQRFTATGIRALRSLTLSEVGAKGKVEGLVDDAETYAAILHDVFDLSLSAAETHTLWEIAQTQHQAFMKNSGG